MRTFNNESFVLDNYRMVPSSRIAFFGNLFRCHRVKALTRSIFFRRSWIDSSLKSDPPPDFYNKKHHIMMEVMMVDDYSNVKNEKYQHNSFEKENTLLEKYLGEDYKTERDDISVYCTPDTSNQDLYNYTGYIQNFEKVVLKHSKKVDNYHRNHPECKEIIFMILDKSDAYFQHLETSNQSRERSENHQSEIIEIHQWYNDRRFIETIKKCNADYVIWFCLGKTVYYYGKEKKLPIVCIYDVKKFKDKGKLYSPNLMSKINNKR